MKHATVHGAIDAAPRLASIDHFTVRCRPDELAALESFYREVLGLSSGRRPLFPFAGHWMYGGDKALVHLAANLTAEKIASARASDCVGDSGFDHVSFRAHDLEETRRRLTRLDIAFDEVPVPGWPLHQIFLHDPSGTKVELTFEVAT